MTQNHTIYSYILHQSSDFKHLPTLTRSISIAYKVKPGLLFLIS